MFAETAGRPRVAFFVRGDAYQDSDAVFGVKESLVVDFDEQTAGSPNPTGREIDGTWTRAGFDVVLSPER